MIVRRLALFVALVVGFAMTQLPEFVEQYRQRLGGAIDELSAVIARFDADSAQQGLTEAGGIDRLKANPERFVQQRGEQMAENVERLQRLRDAQARFRSDGPVTRLVTFLFGGSIAHLAGRPFRGRRPRERERVA